ncbi:F-box protein [Forsythia ovata]|uniref:F-box protein n=1 Tax=Forsythia ovata TaxID=205694 RepID=A0ABD1WLD7_9LAMI
MSNLGIKRKRAKKFEVSKSSINPDWANIGIDILTVVERKINSIYDYLSFSAVCKNWNVVAIQSRCRRMIGSNKDKPLLLLLGDKFDKGIVYHNLDFDRSFTRLNLPRHFPRKYYGSSHGWLIEFDYTSFCFFLINPFTCQVVHIPTFTLPASTVNYNDIQGPYTPYNILKAVLSADPLAFPDYFMMVIYGRTKKLALFEGSLQKWTHLENEQFYSGMHDIIHYKNRFHSIDEDGRVFAFNPSHPQSCDYIFIPRERYDSKIKRKYLVESPGGDLLKILRVPNDSVTRHSPRTLRFDIWKLLEVEGVIEWVAVENLGDVALFLGDNHSLSVVASDYSNCYKNCLFYI